MMGSFFSWAGPQSSMGSSGKVFVALAGSVSMRAGTLLRVRLAFRRSSNKRCSASLLQPPLSTPTGSPKPRWTAVMLLRCSSNVRPRRVLWRTMASLYDVGVSRWLCRIKVWASWGSRRASWSRRGSSCSFRSQAKVCRTFVNHHLTGQAHG